MVKILAVFVSNSVNAFLWALKPSGLIKLHLPDDKRAVIVYFFAKWRRSLHQNDFDDMRNRPKGEKILIFNQIRRLVSLNRNTLALIPNYIFNMSYCIHTHPPYKQVQICF